MPSIPCKDHLGTEYPSQKARAEAWGLPLDTAQARLRGGWTLERALTTPNKGTTAPVTFRGENYAQKAHVFSKFGIHRSTVNGHERRGLSFEDAVEAAIKSTRPPVSFRGEHYDSKTEVYTKFGISSEPVRLLMRSVNYTWEQACEEAIKRQVKNLVYVNGRPFINLTHVANRFEVGYAALYQRLKTRPDVPIEQHIRELRQKAGKTRRKIERPPAILFGWRFNTWGAAFTYWRERGPFVKWHDHKVLYDRIDSSPEGNIDAVLLYVLEAHIEKGNVTDDVRRVDEEVVGKRSRPVERVNPTALSRFPKIPDRLK
ncbi:hypothetical protein [Primorskyibacter sp. S87]|uniref:hypothetical protein n=1 Tax=Primorskyibacter sp. S87 TaxID=3415126 RepID=UPI003C7AF61C